MKRLTWTTTSEYVDMHTGEVITKKQVENEYIITKKNIKKTTYERYIREKNGSQTLTKFGLTTVTNECRREGKQLNLF